MTLAVDRRSWSLHGGTMSNVTRILSAIEAGDQAPRLPPPGASPGGKGCSFPWFHLSGS